MRIMHSYVIPSALTKPPKRASQLGGGGGRTHQTHIIKHKVLCKAI